MTNLEFKTQLERRTKEFAVAAFKYLDALTDQLRRAVLKNTYLSTVRLGLRPAPLNTFTFYF